MNHLKLMSKTNIPAKSAVSALESIVMLILGVTVGEWDNFANVSDNLRKYYTKTEE